MILFLDLIDNQEDKRRFERLYESYSDLLYYIALKRLNSNEDAEECVQDTFFYVAKNFHKIGDVDSPSTKCYLVTIVNGYAINKYNRKKKIETVPLNDDSDIQRLDIELNSMADELNVLELVELIEQLDEELANLMSLKYYYGYESKEIASMFGLSDNLVRYKLWQGRNELKDLIKKAREIK